MLSVPIHFIAVYFCQILRKVQFLTNEKSVDLDIGSRVPIFRLTLH